MGEGKSVTTTIFEIIEEATEKGPSEEMKNKFWNAVFDTSTAVWSEMQEKNIDNNIEIESVIKRYCDFGLDLGAYNHGINDDDVAYELTLGSQAYLRPKELENDDWQECLTVEGAMRTYAYTAVKTMVWRVIDEWQHEQGLVDNYKKHREEF